MVGLLGASITGLAMPAGGFLMAEFAAVFYTRDVDQMRSDARGIGVMLLGIGIAQGVGAVLRQWCFSLISERMVLRVRMAAFEAIVKQPIGWFDVSTDRMAGALANRLSEDCYKLKELTGERVALAASQIAVLVAGLTLSFSSSWMLTLCLFASACAACRGVCCMPWHVLHAVVCAA